jgi:hypothetical protein
VLECSRTCWLLPTQGLVVHSVEKQYLGFAENSAPGSAFADDWFTDPNAKRVYNDFAARISADQKELLELNEKATIPYYYLTPNPVDADYPNRNAPLGIPNSVTI